MTDLRESRIEDFLRGGTTTNVYEDGWNAGVERVWTEVDRLRAENERLRGLLTLWLNLAPADTREIVMGESGRTLGQLTRAAFDEEAR